MPNKTKLLKGHSYKSDADMSDEEIVQGLMEISAISLADSLADEPHKYHSRPHE